MGEDVERPVVRAAEDEVDGALRDIDAADELAVGAEDLHLTSGQIDVSGLILGDAFAPSVGEELHVGDSARVSYVYLVRLLLSLVADVEGMAGKGFRDAEGVEDVGHLGAPGECALNEVLRGGDEDAVVR